MKRTKRIISICLAMVLCISLLCPAIPATLTYAATTLESDSTSAPAGCTTLGLEGKYIADAAKALNRINAIRKEACEEGVLDPRNTTRKLTSSDYVPLTWSTALELIARLRAAESSVTGGHLRLNGAGVFTTTYGGIQSYGECIAWNDSSSLLNGIEQWYDEKNAWVKQDGSDVTGHYELMIDPDYRYIGLGCFYNSSASYKNTTVAEFGDSDSEGSLGTTPLSGYTDAVQKVDVKDSYVSYSLTPKASTILPSGSTTCDLSATITYSNSYSVFSGKTKEAAVVLGNVTYTSSDPSIATVDASGNIRGVAAGTVTITAYINGKSTANCSITVSANGMIKSSKANAWFKITKNGSEVAYVKPISKKKSVTIPATVTIDGVTYKVTSIAANALKGNTKITSVTIGKNVTKIGSKAFYKCKNLKAIKLQSTKLKSIGKQAINGIHKKAVIKIKKNSYKKYKKYFKSSVGYKKTMTLKKY